MSSDSSLTYNYCALPLASYACRPDQSRGRIYPQGESAYRTGFQRDYDRIIHSSAFRRLEYKTQVFVYYQGDHYRNRMSHTLEVVQIAATLARALMVNEDLAKTVALAHDLGHAPFAHMGEDILKECMKDYGGFYHNDQSLRILTTLEETYLDWPGLNLTWETLEGVAKHNGPVLKKGEPMTRETLSIALFELSQKMDMELDRYASIEAQCAAIADDIAYNNHDVQDGLRAGFFTIDELSALSLFKSRIAKIRQDYPHLREKIFISELVRSMIGEMVEDVLTTSRANIKRLNPQSPQDVSLAGEQIVCFSEGMNTKVNELRKFLMSRMYRHDSIEKIRTRVERVIPDLFNAFLSSREGLPEDWMLRMNACEEGDVVSRARIVCDYVAGMTDRFAVREYNRMFALNWDPI